MLAPILGPNTGKNTHPNQTQPQPHSHSHTATTCLPMALAASSPAATHFVGSAVAGNRACHRRGKGTQQRRTTSLQRGALHIVDRSSPLVATNSKSGREYEGIVCTSSFRMQRSDLSTKPTKSQCKLRSGVCPVEVRMSSMICLAVSRPISANSSISLPLSLLRFG